MHMTLFNRLIYRAYLCLFGLCLLVESAVRLVVRPFTK